MHLPTTAQANMQPRSWLKALVQAGLKGSSAPCCAILRLPFKQNRLLFTGKPGPCMAQQGSEISHGAGLHLFLLTICPPAAERKTTSAQALLQWSPAGQRTFLCLVPRG